MKNSNLLTCGLALLFADSAAAQVTELVSVASGGVHGNWYSGAYGVAISADGRYLAFESIATNLVPIGSDGSQLIFVRDRIADTTRLVSLSTAGVPANGGCNFPAISADGRFVAFVSWASNLVPGDTNA